MASEMLEDARRRLLAGLKNQGLRQIVEVVPSRSYIAGGPKPLEWTPIGQRSKEGNGAATIGYLDRFTGLDPSQ